MPVYGYAKDFVSVRQSLAELVLICLVSAKISRVKPSTPFSLT